MHDSKINIRLALIFVAILAFRGTLHVLEDFGERITMSVLLAYVAGRVLSIQRPDIQQPTS